MTYCVTVGSKVTYDVHVNAESFDEAAKTTLEQVNDIDNQICAAARGIVPEGVLADSINTVEAIYA